MPTIFTRTTSILSTQFVGCFDADKLALTLYKVGQETGVEFNRHEETFSIAGQWLSIVKAHHSLEQHFEHETQYPSLHCGRIQQIENKPVDTEKETNNVCTSNSASNLHELKSKNNPKVVLNDPSKRGRKPGSSVRVGPANANIPEPVVLYQYKDEPIIIQNVLKPSNLNKEINLKQTPVNRDGLTDADKALAASLSESTESKKPTYDRVNTIKGPSVGELNESAQVTDISASKCTIASGANHHLTKNITNYEMTVTKPEKSSNLKSTTANVFNPESYSRQVKHAILELKEEKTESTSQSMNTLELKSEKSDDENDDILQDFNDDSSTDVDERYLCSDTAEPKADSAKMPCDSLRVKIKIEPGICNDMTEDVNESNLEEKELNSLNTDQTNVSPRKTDEQDKRYVGKRKIYSCSQCSYVGHKKENLKVHMKRKHRKKYTCDVCDKQFGFNKDMRRHKRTVHSDTGFPCKICSKLYKCKRTLARHIKTHKNSASKLVSLKMKKEDGDSELVDDPSASQSMSEEGEQHVKEKGYKCSQCSYTGNRESLLKEHLKRMHRNRFTCDICHKKFGLNKDLTRHTKRVHTDPAFFCEVCRKFYKSKRSYDEHIQTHSEDYVKENFKCKLCPKSFCTKYVLAGHIKSEHLGIKNTFMCPTCGRSFTQKSSYLTHANVHAGIKPFVCDICGYACTYENSYKRHKMSHENTANFSCEICAKKFTHPANLRTHLKTHKGKKDHLCTTCGKGFTQKQALIRHERIHTGDKPFTCRLCSRAFTDYSIIRRHLMLMHKKAAKDWKNDIISNLKRSTGYFIEDITVKEVDEHHSVDAVQPSANIGTDKDMILEDGVSDSQSNVDTFPMQNTEVKGVHQPDSYI